MKQKKKKKSLIVMALLMVVGLTCSATAGTYAKYTAEIDGNQGTATVAKWSFEADNPAQTLTINFDETYDASTLVADRIAPGTSGSFNIELNNENSEVGVDWKIVFDNPTNKPTNFKFYSDAAHQNEITSATPLTGQLTAEDETGLTVPIYWEWAYETGTVTDGIAAGDSDDTTDGLAASTMTVNATITGVQTTPSATAITSHVNTGA